MKPTVAILAAGNMGAAVARRLTENGITVLTSLAGRSDASRGRAIAAGMQDVAFQKLVETDLFLSIVPPAEAMATATRFTSEFGDSNRSCSYVDCNAVSPATARKIGVILDPSRCNYVDASIIGVPPEAGKPKPVFYASGPNAAPFAALADFGLDIRRLESGIGAASALKMSYAGITKGLTGLATAMMLAATREGAAKALHDELRRSQPGLLTWFEPQVPGMLPKAYRWVAEMEEIAGFLAADESAASMFNGLARLYERLATDVKNEKREAEALLAFLAQARE
jgi:3-hydroxyisobutyrate dehydrogenase-like beta-hydroxyacid dehydrogenase